MNLQIQTIVIVALGILTLPLIFYAYAQIIARHQPRRNSSRYLREQIEELAFKVDKLDYKFTTEMPIDTDGKLNDLKQRLNQLETKLDEQDEDSIPTKLQWLTERLSGLNSMNTSQNVINKDFTEKIARLQNSMNVNYSRLSKFQAGLDKEMDNLRNLISTVGTELKDLTDEVRETNERNQKRINEIA